MRATWKGIVAIGLVHIPVKAYSTARSAEHCHLRQIHAGCGEPIGYRKSCPQHGDLTADQIGSAFEVEPGKLLELCETDLEDLAPEAPGGSVSIVHCVEADELLDHLQYVQGKHYFLAPENPVAAVPFGLLRGGLQRQGRLAVASAVLFGREQLLLLRPMGELLAADALAFSAEVHATDLAAAQVPAATLEKAEQVLMEKLLAQLTRPFGLEEYSDGYQRRLQELVQAKLARQPRRRRPATPQRPPQSLEEALRGSLKKTSKVA